MKLWHHDIHEHKLGENLIYFQLSFVPVYKRKRISEIIAAVFQENEITSFCVYEIYGLYDIIIRAWVPLHIGGVRLMTTLQRALEDVGCSRVLPFFVSSTILHWTWWDKVSKSMWNPAHEELLILDPSTMLQVEQGYASKELEADLKQRHFLGDYESSTNGGVSAEGIKFFIVIPPPILGVTPAKETEDVILNNLRNLLTRSERLLEPSLYIGSGFAWILIKGKVTLGSYSEIDRIVQTVNDLGVHGYYIRTYTYLVAGSEPPYTREQESVSRAIKRHLVGSGDSRRTTPLGAANLTELHRVLQDYEDERFEVKAGLKLNINKFLFEEKHPLIPDNQLAIDGVLKSVVAFLNTEGGIIVLGALEKRRYENLFVANSPLNGLPIIGNWIITGVNWEYAYARNLDGFLLALADLVKDHIGADASALISMEPISYEGRDIVIIKVPKGFSWYYLDKRSFFVRRSGSTIALEGHDRERYQQHLS